MKYGEWSSHWLERYVKPVVKLRTYEHYKYLLEKHVTPYLGELELKKISCEALQALVLRLCEDKSADGAGLSTNTVNSVISLLKGSFRGAKETGKIQSDVSEGIRRPRKNERTVECFNICDQKKIEEAALKSEKPKTFGVLLSLYTGLRIGELLALEWSDINIERRELYVSKSCYDGKGEGMERRITGTPKTFSSRRVIPLPNSLMPLIEEHKRKSRSRWVISNGEEGVGVRSYQRSFELLLKRAGVEHKGFHALRHTFATRAIECGMDVKTLSEILGHKNSTVTLNLYVHSMTEHKKRMMDMLGENFF